MTFTVTAFLDAGIERTFPAKTILKAREIATRIITTGLWVVDDQEETFIPSCRIYKVTVRIDGVGAALRAPGEKA